MGLKINKMQFNSIQFHLYKGIDVYLRGRTGWCGSIHLTWYLTVCQSEQQFKHVVGKGWRDRGFIARRRDYEESWYLGIRVEEEIILYMEINTQELNAHLSGIQKKEHTRSLRKYHYGFFQIKDL